jgi:hypothetical protein
LFFPFGAGINKIISQFLRNKFILCRYLFVLNDAKSKNPAQGLEKMNVRLSAEDSAVASIIGKKRRLSAMILR